MAQNGTESSATGKKRSFSAYSHDNMIVIFDVEGEDLEVHKYLLDQHVPNWSNKFELKTEPRQDRLRGSVHCANCPHKFTDIISLYVFRGFRYWLYLRELPDNDSIREEDYPKVWEEGEVDLEKQPLDCRMALELYHFGRFFGFGKLLDAVCSFLFSYYKRKRSVPTFPQIDEIFNGGHVESNPLKRLCTDLYYKWYTGSDLELNLARVDFPDDFLWHMFKRNCERNAQTAKKGKEHGFVIKCSHYHHNKTESNCRCQGPYVDDIFIIR